MKKLIGGILMAGFSAGCVCAPFQPPAGIVSSYAAPLSTEGNWRQGSKTGSADAICVLGIVAVGDCSLDRAIKNGNLKEAYYADYKYFNVLGIYQSVTVNVIGE